MQGLFQSAFFHALGYAIINSLWQTAIVWLLYLLISHTLTLAATVKYRMAVFAQLLCFAWFWITLIFYGNQSLHFNTLTYSDQFSQTNTMGAVIAKQLVDWLLKAEQVFPYISLAYLLVLSVMVVRFMTAYRHTQMIRQSGLVKMPVEWRIFISRLSVQFSLKREVRIFLSEKIRTPLTIGFLKPVILIPIASINHLTTEQLEAVLLHEMAHIKRFDYMVNLLVSLVELSLFFTPFVHLISRHIQKERENSCDDWVLQYQYKADNYAEALLRLACIQNTPAFAMTASGRKKELLSRIQRMMGQKENRLSCRKCMLGFGLIALVLGSFVWLDSSVKNNLPENANVPFSKTNLTRPLTKHPFLISNRIMPGTLALQPTISLAFLQEPAMSKQVFLPDIKIFVPKAENKAVLKNDPVLPDKRILVNYQALKKNSPAQLIPLKIVALTTKSTSKQHEQIMPPPIPVLQTEVLPNLIESVSIDDQDMALTVNNTYDLLKKMDLEKFIADIIHYGHLDDQAKAMILNQLKKIQLTPKEKDLLIREVKAKQIIRKLTHIEHSGNRINVSLSDSDILVMTPDNDLNEVDNKRVIQIKLAVLKQLNLLNIKLLPIGTYLRKNENGEILIDQQ